MILINHCNFYVNIHILTFDMPKHSKEDYISKKMIRTRFNSHEIENIPIHGAGGLQSLDLNFGWNFTPIQNWLGSSKICKGLKLSKKKIITKMKNKGAKYQPNRQWNTKDTHKETLRKGNQSGAWYKFNLLKV